MTEESFVVISVGDYNDSLHLSCCGRVFTLWHGTRHAEIKIAEHIEKGCKKWAMSRSMSRVKECFRFYFYSFPFWCDYCECERDRDDDHHDEFFCFDDVELCAKGVQASLSGKPPQNPTSDS